VHDRYGRNQIFFNHLDSEDVASNEMSNFHNVLAIPVLSYSTLT